MTKTTPRRVDFIRDLDDFRVALFGTLGKSTAYIARTTHLTSHQVAYRLAKAKIRRADYRNGTSDYDRLILNHVEDDLSRVLRRELTRQFGRK